MHRKKRLEEKDLERKKRAEWVRLKQLEDPQLAMYANFARREVLREMVTYDVFLCTRSKLGLDDVKACGLIFIEPPTMLLQLFFCRRLRYFREEMKARNVYVINKLRWDHRALKNVPSALRHHNQSGGRKYEFPKKVRKCLSQLSLPSFSPRICRSKRRS